jgi:hypothetical protein
MSQHVHMPSVASGRLHREVTAQEIAEDHLWRRDEVLKFIAILITLTGRVGFSGGLKPYDNCHGGFRIIDGFQRQSSALWNLQIGHHGEIQEQMACILQMYMLVAKGTYLYKGLLYQGVQASTAEVSFISGTQAPPNG